MNLIHVNIAKFDFSSPKGFRLSVAVPINFFF